VDFGEHVRDYERYQGYSGREMHNLYPLLYNRAAFEVSQEFFRRGVIWARSAYAGSQRYPVHWSGDNSSTFENILCSLRGGLSFGQSGFTFWSNDVGGFTGTPSDRLYVRWTQFGIFNSHMRLHGGGPRYREPWNYGEQAQDIFRRMVELRYRFLPYLYSEAHHSARAGLPVMRPPILDESDERKIYFPAGRWADGWTGDLITGPCWLDYQADLERVPFFYRGGYAVPQGPIMQYVDELPLDPMTLHIALDEEGRAGCTMIDDDETVTVSGLLRDGTFELQVGSNPRGLVLHIYTTEKIESLVCNGQEVIPQQVSDHHYTGELDI
jgi:alpha-D-xyloside xylohydrolase